MKLQKLEALKRRLPLNHEKRRDIEEEYAKTMAGYRGEQTVDYHLKILHNDKNFILHDIRLLNGSAFFQIDTLICNPAFFLIIEVKNISGTLIFDQVFHQLIRNSNGKEEAFPDPISQVKRHHHQLTTWLKDNKVPEIPVEWIVVISHPSTLIKSSPINSNIGKKIIHSAALSNIIEEFTNKYKEKKFSNLDLKKLSN
ncbi:NERD domain-containing protein [Bacillus sp. IB182487]|uniref:NERD domain-containing protein n=1 Tax=Metabacillus arenae TaxID=2771434 RepID=A0A926NMV6_9BACI|nr:nuclease-related domain-containing protein [Metabacillus arenae]MBD1383625.1 NERD domain-containing protein [Metabacillus arenae]